MRLKHYLLSVMLLVAFGGLAETSSVEVADSFLDLDAEITRFRVFPGGTSAIWKDGAPEFTLTAGDVYCDACPYVKPGQPAVRGPGTLVLRLANPPSGTLCLRFSNLEDRTEKTFSAKFAEEMRIDLPSGLWQYQSMNCYAQKRPWTFRLLSADAVGRSTPAEACRLDVETGNPLHLVQKDSALALTLRNAASERLAWSGEAVATDFFGHSFSFGFDVAADPGETVRVPFGLKERRKGVWCLKAKIRSRGTEAERNVSFAVLDEHPVTPLLKKPKFRMGLVFHMPSHSTKLRGILRGALVACGAKIVRGSVGNFADIGNKGLDQLNWALPDAKVSEFLGDGIAIDSIIYACPKWARPESLMDYRGARDREIPPRPGVFRQFAETLASRYGDKIDYYEIGNEWDLLPKEVMPLDEAVRVQREAYEGIKAGCADACVLVNGWACSISTEFPKGRMPQPGFIERFSEQAKDWYDVHAVHLHGPWRDYPKRVQNLLRLQKQIGTAGKKPWFANETALSCSGGIEDEVALTVWRKILYSWAYGSTDYVWYNLRATGRKENDSEQLYGLLDADLHPRAGYAAFSALSALTMGLDADGLLCNDVKRFAFRLKGTTVLDWNGRVIAGWDEAAEKPVDIVVRTDAKRAFVSDVMGNREPVAIVGGRTVWPLGKLPTALCLEGATFADPEEELTRVPPLSYPVTRIPTPQKGRAPDFVLDDIKQITDYYQADPSAVERVWKGRDDLSARVWFDKNGTNLTVKVAVTDNVDAAARAGFDETDGDLVVLHIRRPGASLERLTLRRVKRSGDISAYRADIPLDEPRADVKIDIFDNDGQGANRVLMMNWARLEF